MQVGALSRFVAVAAAAFVLLAAPTAAQSPVPVRVISFGGGFNLPLWVGQARGFFAANGVDVRLSYTPDSKALFADLAAGRWVVGAVVRRYYDRGDCDSVARGGG